MIETILLALATFHATLLAVVAILVALGWLRPSAAATATRALVERFLVAYCRAHVPTTPDGEELVDLTRWIGRCS